MTNIIIKASAFPSLDEAIKYAESLVDLGNVFIDDSWDIVDKEMVDEYMAHITNYLRYHLHKKRPKIPKWKR